jgi:uncharacterized membrane protein
MTFVMTRHPWHTRDMATDSPRAGDERPAESSFGYVASAERTKAFTDAVVAIAMTLLILPLLESVGEAVKSGDDTLQWLNAEGGALFSFALSFVIIANLWVSHHRIFTNVERVSNALLWITIAWMFTIVWLPVPTAIVGQMHDDAMQKVLYIGTMILASVLLAVTRLYLRAHPELHDLAPRSLQRGLVAEFVTVFLFVVALVLALAIPGISYFPMFLLLLTQPVFLLVMRFVRPPAS